MSSPRIWRRGFLSSCRIQPLDYVYMCSGSANVMATAPQNKDRIVVEWTDDKQHSSVVCEADILANYELLAVYLANYAAGIPNGMVHKARIWIRPRLIKPP